MNKLGAGILLVILGGFMHSIRVISAALYMSGAASQSRELFKAGLDYVGIDQDILSAAAVLTGVVFIAVYLHDSYRKK